MSPKWRTDDCEIELGESGMLARMTRVTNARELLTDAASPLIQV